MTSIISDLANNKNAVSSRIDNFFIQNSFSRLLKKCNFYKESGIPCVTILKELFTLVFTSKNLFRTLEMKPEDLSFRKNTAYRFLNCGHYKKRDVICMLKITEKIHYLHDGKWQPIKELRKLAGDIANAKTGIIGSVIVQIREAKKSQEFMDVRIVFVQDRRSKNWLAILSTDLELSEKEIVRIYGKRWDIEVFFKVCKSYLTLAKEYQGRNYDAQVAATSIVFLRYAMLAIESRNTQDDRTIGELFYYCSDEMDDLKLSQSLMISSYAVSG